jgi:hypothetical protein
LDNRLFVSELNGPQIEQIDSLTGAQQGLVIGNYGGALRLSPDRKILYEGEVAVTPPALAAIDVSTLSTTLLQQTPFDQFPRGYIADFKLSPDGSFLFVPGDVKGAVSKLSSEDLSSSLAEYLIPGLSLLGDGPVTGSALALSPDAGTLYVTAFHFDNPTTATIDLFNVVTGKYLRTIPMSSFLPSSFAVDTTGRYLFAATQTNDYQLSQLRVYATGAPVMPLHPPKPQSLLNVSTRLRSQPGDSILIGGFIISGTESKQIAVRGMGPSLPVTGKLIDPILNVYDNAGKLIVSNDNWNSSRASVLSTGLAPVDEHEAVSILTLSPGNYTVTVGGADDGSGVALVEVYDLTPDTNSALANFPRAAMWKQATMS